MAKHRNPPHNFIIKGDAIHLTGVKKKLSPQEEHQLWAVLSQRHWNRIFSNFGKSLKKTLEENRRQSVTDN